MRFLTILFLVGFIAFSVPSLNLLADDEVTDKAEKPDVKDKTKYDLTPKFTKDMKWKESMTVTYSQTSDSSVRTSKFEKTANIVISTIKESNPSKLKFKDFSGKLTISDVDLEGEEDDYVKEVELEKEDKEYELDADLKLTSVESRKIYEFEVMYPNGNILGFLVPKDQVKVGDEWKSESLIPLNLHLFGERAKMMGLNIKDIESKFKLKEVKKNKDIHVAIITWTGKFTMSIMRDTVIEFTWKGETEFDLVNKRINTTKCVTEGEEDGKQIKFECSRELKYDSAEKPDNKPEVAPKTDDDE